MLNHTKGNLIDMAEQGLFDVIVHGCNCLNTMGSGIAAEIRDRHPQAYEADTTYSSDVSNNIEKLGNFSFYSHPNRFIIINAYTQVNYLPRGEDHFEYDSFAVILRKVYLLGAKLRYGFPYIGMGLAGGDKDRIIAMLEDFATRVTEAGGTVTLVEFA